MNCNESMVLWSATVKKKEKNLLSIPCVLLSLSPQRTRGQTEPMKVKESVAS